MKWQIFESGGWDVCTLNGCGAPDHGRWNKQYNGAIRESFLFVRKSSTFWKATVWNAKEPAWSNICPYGAYVMTGRHSGVRCWTFLNNVVQHHLLQKKTKTKQKKPLALNLVNIVYWLTIDHKESDRDKNSFRTTFFFSIRDKMLSAINRRHIFTSNDLNLL